MEKIGLNSRNSNWRKILAAKLATTNEAEINKYLEIAAVSYQSEVDQDKIKSDDLDDLKGRIIDIRQNEQWFRTRIIKHNLADDSALIDSSGLDTWPFDWHEIYLDELRHELDAIKLRDNNVLSFTNNKLNVGKIIFINGKPTYQTH